METVTPPPVTAPQIHQPFLRRLSPIPFAVLSLILVFFLYQIVAGTATLLLFKGKVTSDNVDLVRWSTLIAQLLCILLPTLILARLRSGGVMDFLRVRLPEVREIAVTVVAVFALQQVLQGYMILQEAIPLPEPIQRYIDMFKELFEQTYRMLVSASTPLEFVFVVIIVALVPAVAEEFLFRGIVQRSIESEVGGFRGAVIAGIIFGAYHLNPFSIVPLIALGVFFGFLVYRSQNIILAVSAHFFNNFIACTAVYLNLSDDFVAIAPEGNATASIAVANGVVFAVVFVAATLYFMRITEHAPHDG